MQSPWHLLTLLSLVVPIRAVEWTVGQIVQTSSGPVQGHASQYNPQVSEYLNIPFAEAPVGNLRWAAPVRFSGSVAINGTAPGNSCPREVAPQPIGRARLALANVTDNGAAILRIQSEGNNSFSEDCLNLNVWTKPQTGEEKKAVIVFIHGGAFSSGSNVNPYQDGSKFADEQDVVMVSMNYRLNVFGFPGHPDPKTAPYNLGLLDQRLALEWIRDNIANFGGDPGRITIFGTSAGGASVDYLNYAYADDPIAAAFIPASGTGTSFGASDLNQAASQWFRLSTNLNCGNRSANLNTVLACLRGKRTEEVLKAIPEVEGFAAILGAFRPTIDGTLVFSEYASRKPAPGPVLVGSNEDEGLLFRMAYALQGKTFPDGLWTGMTQTIFTCPAALRANRSLNAGVPTWRYRFFGAFPNTQLTSVPYSGAWHGSQNLVLFGNSELSGLPDTEPEVQIASYMRGAWAAFAKNPTSGLSEYKWPMYSPQGITLARIGFENRTGGNFALGNEYDGGCASTVAVTVTPSVQPPASQPTQTSPATTTTTTPNSGSALRVPHIRGLLLVMMAGWLV